MISPDVTKNNYSMLNNSPSQKAFYLGLSQNSQALKERGPEQLATVTNKFLQSNLRPRRAS